MDIFKQSSILFLCCTLLGAKCSVQVVEEPYIYMTYEGLYKDEKKNGKNIYIPLIKFMRIFAVFEDIFYTVWRKTSTVLRA